MDTHRYEHVPEPVFLIAMWQTLPSLNKTELEMHRIEAFGRHQVHMQTQI